MNLCKYKNILGESGKGIHSVRFLGLALFDLLGTIILSIIFTKNRTKYNILQTFIILMLITIIIHKLFCVDTALNKFIGI